MLGDRSLESVGVVRWTADPFGESRQFVKRLTDEAGSLFVKVFDTFLTRALRNRARSCSLVLTSNLVESQ